MSVYFKSNDIVKLLDDFDSVSLGEMDGVKLMNRIDTKYIFNTSALGEIITQLKPYYKALTINNHRLFPYSTTYFDTPDFALYNDHQNGKLNRYKIRFRRYDTFGNSFMEIKLKTNKQQTRKKRQEITGHDCIPAEALNLIESETGYKFSDLNQTLVNKFKRITLVNNDFTERLTFDFNLVFQNDHDKEEIRNIVIAELKQDKYSNISSFYTIMKDRGIRKLSVSKYCLGMILLNPELKWNSFKPKMLQIQKVAI
jgi:hypothetical protein